MSKPLILVTNDDSIYSKGIKALVEAMSEIGDVVVVAPDKPQSGMGHAVTLNKPLRLNKISRFNQVEESYTCSGTPVDCVKIARDIVLHRKPDLCVSGINHGSNSSINILYSGTMSAAVEAAIEHIPSIGFSLCSHDLDADFAAAAHYAKVIAQQILKHPLEKGILLNVNIPYLPLNEIKGIKTGHQAIAKWEEEFEERIDPRGSKYYWLTGKFVNYDKRENTDEWALENGYVSIVPVQFDMTSQKGIETIHHHWRYDQ
ncbi:MAG: 5'/3'-nucleotidase SurE [Chitinophagales bacterium]|nr:5'/3'-nucleotidase SurE [Chitinophagales bacterium]